VSSKESKRTLGVHICVSITWKGQFQVMKEKIEIAIAKLNNTNIKIPLIYIFFNVYSIKSVYFGCRIMELLDSQKKELKRIYKEIILVKLNLGRKFP